MQIMVRILMPILVVIVVWFLFSRMNKSNYEERIKDLSAECIVVHLPKINLWIGFLIVVVCTTFCYFMLFFKNGTEAWWVWVTVLILILGGFYIIFESLFFEIDIFMNEDYFLFKKIFVRPQKIYYCDCISYKCTLNTFVIKTTRNKISMDIHAVNLQFLMDMLNDKNVKEIR